MCAVDSEDLVCMCVLVVLVWLGVCWLVLRFWCVLVLRFWCVCVGSEKCVCAVVYEAGSGSSELMDSCCHANASAII